MQNIQRNQISLDALFCLIFGETYLKQGNYKDIADIDLIINNSEKLQLEKLAKNPDLKQINTIEKENLLLLKSIEKDYYETLEFNRTLAKPMNLFNFDREFLEITSNYTKVISELEKGNKRKSSSAIEINIKSLDQLIFAIDQMLNKDKKKENEANIEDLKQILDNLILVSFDQEKILNKLLDVDFNNPLINEIKVKQKNIASQEELD